MSVAGLTVYSAVFGRPELFQPVRCDTTGVESWLCFTDLPGLVVPSPWQVIIMPRPHENARLANRLLKLQPWRVVSAAETVYCDPTIRWVRSPAGMATAEAPVCIRRHGRRETVEQELRAHRCRRAYQPEARALISGIVDLAAAMTRCSIIWRRDCDAVRRLGEEWWSILEQYPPRDQLFFMYAARKADCSVKLYEGRALFRCHKHHYPLSGVLRA